MEQNICNYIAVGIVFNKFYVAFELLDLNRK